MDTSVVHNEGNDDMTLYLLDKAIWEKYNMVETRINVINFIRQYKEARAMNIESLLYSSHGLTSHISIDKTLSSFKNKGDFTLSADKKMDSQALLDVLVPLIVKVKNSFTDLENKYYEFCLASNNSEENLCQQLGITKPGLAPIKNSCLLKIAFAAQIAVPK